MHRFERILRAHQIALQMIDGGGRIDDRLMRCDRNLVKSRL